MTEIEDLLTLQVFEYIKDYLQEQEQLSPTYREIAEGSLMAMSTMAQHLVRLESKEWIIREYKLPRSIRLGKNAPTDKQLQKMKEVAQKKALEATRKAALKKVVSE
jgi:SOS-response transcriptional repressor LexA